ncbi:hypothetical protein INR49_008970 [Caranx melampygus]|nr:hypothetical protein INR49_008970 [Caranx melampygus]
MLTNFQQIKSVKKCITPVRGSDCVHITSLGSTARPTESNCTAPFPEQPGWSNLQLLQCGEALCRPLTFPNTRSENMCFSAPFAPGRAALSCWNRRRPSLKCQHTNNLRAKVLRSTGTLKYI